MSASPAGRGNSRLSHPEIPEALPPPSARGCLLPPLRGRSAPVLTLGFLLPTCAPPKCPWGPEETDLKSSSRGGETEALSPREGCSGFQPPPPRPLPPGTATLRRARSRTAQNGPPQRALTSSTTRPSGCPSAPTSRYTRGFPEDEPPPLPALHARAAGKSRGAERGPRHRPSRREPQRSASIAGRVG